MTAATTPFLCTYVLLTLGSHFAVAAHQARAGEPAEPLFLKYELTQCFRGYCKIMTLMDINTSTSRVTCNPPFCLYWASPLYNFGMPLSTLRQEHFIPRCRTT